MFNRYSVLHHPFFLLKRINVETLRKKDEKKTNIVQQRSKPLKHYRKGYLLKFLLSLIGDCINYL